MAKNEASRELICDSMDQVDLMPETTEEDILQCMKTIVTVNQGSCPMCREIGTASDPVHRRENVARVLLVRDIFEAIRDQETRANITAVNFQESEKTGTVIPVVEVELNG